jgi:hypothetical protein
VASTGQGKLSSSAVAQQRFRLNRLLEPRILGDIGCKQPLGAQSLQQCDGMCNSPISLLIVPLYMIRPGQMEAAPCGLPDRRSMVMAGRCLPPLVHLCSILSCTRPPGAPMPSNTKFLSKILLPLSAIQKVDLRSYMMELGRMVTLR